MTERKNIGGAAAVTPLVASLLLNVTPNDPLGYLIVAAVLGVVALIPGFRRRGRRRSIR